MKGKRVKILDLKYKLGKTNNRICKNSLKNKYIEKNYKTNFYLKLSNNCTFNLSKAE